MAAVLGGRSEVWLCASIVSTLFAFSWDVLVDWGLGPQPMRRAVRQCLTPGAPQGGEFADASWWLRPVRVFPTSWYIVGIIADLVLRLSWAVYISPGQQVWDAAPARHHDGIPLTTLARRHLNADCDLDTGVSSLAR